MELLFAAALQAHWMPQPQLYYQLSVILNQLDYDSIKTKVHRANYSNGSMLG